MTSAALTPAKSKTFKPASATKPIPKPLHKQLKKVPAKKLQQPSLSKVKAKGHSHCRGQGVIEVDDEIDIVMPERRLHSGQVLKNEARKRLIRKARSHASRAVEKRRLRSDTRREQDYELAIAQGFTGDLHMEETTPWEAQVFKKHGRPKDSAKARKRKLIAKSKPLSARSVDKKRKVRKSVRDLLEEAESPNAAIVMGDSPVKVDRSLAKAPSKSSVLQKSELDAKSDRHPKKRANSVDSYPAKKLKSLKSPSPPKDYKKTKDGKKHKKSESPLVSLKQAIVTASGTTAKKARETSVERHRVGPPGVKQPPEKAAKVMKSPGSKKGNPKSLAPPATGKLLPPIFGGSCSSH